MDHLTTDEVALLSRGELPPERLDHAAGCDSCTELAAAVLDNVTGAISALPTPAMPAEVVARLDEVIAAEALRRSSGEADREAAAQQAAHAKRFSLGSFGDNSPHCDVLTKTHPTAGRPAAARRST